MSERIKFLKQQTSDLKQEVINLLGLDDVFHASLKMLVLLERQTELKTLEIQQEIENARHSFIGEDVRKSRTKGK